MKKNYSDNFDNLLKNKHYPVYKDLEQNKVYDFRTKELRYIRPDDYVTTNTGYDYPEYIEEENTEFINKYFDTLFPNQAIKEYILDSCCSTLNGDTREQYFNIHTGSGSTKEVCQRYW